MNGSEVIEEARVDPSPKWRWRPETREGLATSPPPSLLSILGNWEGGYVLLLLGVVGIFV